METEEGDPARMQRLLAVNMLYTFIASALAVLVPLYLLERQVDIAWIGVILSVGPLSFMVIRILLASIADEIGTKKIAILYSAMNVVSILFYIFVASPLGFAAATLSEGVRNSGFWAIARTEVLSANGKGDPGKALVRFSNMRQLADGAGRLAVGAALAYLAFSGAFAAFLLLSVLLLGLIAWGEKMPSGGMRVDRDTLARIFKKRPKTFWHASFLQLLIWLAYNMLIGFLLPLFLISGIGLDYGAAGTLLALHSIATFIFAFAFLRLNLPKSTLILASFASVPALVALPFAPGLLLPLLAIVAAGYGCGYIVAEHILADQVYRSKDLSTDIGVLYAPLKVSEFLFLSLGGLVIKEFGFAPLFGLLALSLALFVVFGRTLMAPPAKKPLFAPPGKA
ncbi:MAG: MFS transporter [Candidatus Micrarchaeota archaeon]